MSSVEDLKYHLVFATKYRYNLITQKVAEALKNYFIKQQEKLNFTVQSLAIETNHVYLQLQSSTQDLNALIQKLKGGSSYLIRKNFKHLKRYASIRTLRQSEGGHHEQHAVAQRLGHRRGRHEAP